MAESSLVDMQKLARRLWEKDARLWSEDEHTQQAVNNRLGWLDVVGEMVEQADALTSLRASVQSSDIDHLVLLGMGGSSLCPEVCAKVFGVLNFFALDSTVPAAVRNIERQIDPARTIFIVSSKSGTTIETRAFADYFYSLVVPVLADPGHHFFAITDPDTPLADLARERRFNSIWLNRADIGGRYSALSYFGLVPMAMMGLDVRSILESASGMARSCAADVPVPENPGVSLGIALGESFRAGRDKLTFFLSPRLAPFGDWVEQLIAESTGKEELGIIPVHGEPRGQVADYGNDRCFVSLRLASEAEDVDEVLLAGLEGAGHPVIRLLLQDATDLGAEFFRWEVATAVAGSLMGINPFDEPNVKEAKDRTAELLSAYDMAGSLPEPEPVHHDGDLTLYADLEVDADLAAAAAADLDLVGWLRAHLGRAARPDYFTIQSFLAPDEGIELQMAGLRRVVRDHLGVASTFGWGPRFLHSTGQLHKGGPNNGVFLQVTANDPRDLDCPGRAYSFGVLARAQALGDMQALQNKQRRVLRVHASGDLRPAVDRLVTAVDEALR